MGMGTSARYLVGYIYLSELLHPSIRNFPLSFSLFLTAQSATLATLFFWFIAKDWIYLQLVSILLAFMSLLAVFFLPESPTFLLAQGQYKKAI